MAHFLKKQIVTLIISAAISALSPAFSMEDEELRFPNPSGPFSVGYKDFEFADENYEDPYNPGHHRKLKVTVWYPSQDTLKLEPYGTDEMEITAQDKERLMSSVPQDLQETMLHSISQYACLHIYKSKNAVTAPGKFPGIIFSPGYIAKAISYQRISHDLVSHGYVLMAIHHPYLTDRVKFERGTVFREKDNPDELALQTYRNDIASVLRSLSVLAISLGLQTTLDLDCIGIMGHSIGGEAAMRIAHDPSANIKAAVCLDSTHSLKGVKRQNREYSGGCEGFDCPFMHILAGAHPLNGATTQSLERAETEFNSIHLKKNNYKVLMRQATHTCFGDDGLLKQILPSIGIEEVWGLPENYVEENYKNTTLLLRSFFDLFLKNKTEIDLMALSDENICIETAQY